MNVMKTMFALTLGSVGIMGAMSAHAWGLNTGNTLTITAGTTAIDVNGNPYITSGSFFAVDTSADSIIQDNEKIVLSQGTTGIVIGVATTPGASHLGDPTASDTNEITAPWSFLGNTGSDYTTVGIAAIGGDTANGLDMSGWKVTWNGIENDLGTGAWQILNASSGMPTSGYTNGTGIFNWSGVYGDSYTLDYTATVQAAPFAGIQWALHLEGVTAVPEASTYGMMLAGLGLVGVAARRRKHTEK